MNLRFPLKHNLTLIIRVIYSYASLLYNPPYGEIYDNNVSGC